VLVLMKEQINSLAGNHVKRNRVVIDRWGRFLQQHSVCPVYVVAEVERGYSGSLLAICTLLTDHIRSYYVCSFAGHTRSIGNLRDKPTAALPSHAGNRSFVKYQASGRCPALSDSDQLLSVGAGQPACLSVLLACSIFLL
jgi:hypothetical protein